MSEPPRTPPGGGPPGPEGDRDARNGAAAPDDVPAMIGQLVAERYRVLELLGRGAMGSVFLAEHVRMGRQDALKILSRRLSEDPDAIARFTREARNASFISHENVCEIYDFGETEDGLLFLAMQFVDGETLGDLMEREGPLPPDRVARIGIQVTRALEAAHARGIVHRDLKPHNIMLTRAIDGSELVKVVDFGIAKAIGGDDDAQEVTRAGWIVGTPEYVSPEQLSGLPIDGRSDVYSLGIVLFKALTGALPFTGSTWQEVMTARLSESPRSIVALRPGEVGGEAGSILARLQTVIDRALARDAESRYAGAAELGRALEELLDPPGRARDPAPVPPTVAEPDAGSPVDRLPSAGASHRPAASGDDGRPGWLPWIAAGVVGGTLALGAVGWASGWFTGTPDVNGPDPGSIVIDSQAPGEEPDDPTSDDSLLDDPDETDDPGASDSATPPPGPGDREEEDPGAESDPSSLAQANSTIVRQLTALTAVDPPPTTARVQAARDTAEILWNRTELPNAARARAAFVVASALQDLDEPGALIWAERAVDLAPENDTYRDFRDRLRGGRP